MGLKGAILGDIAGSIYEFYQEDTPDDDLYYGIHTKKATPTDDTVLSIATAKAIMARDYDFGRYYRMLANEYPSMGYGGRFAAWMGKADSPAYNSFGNGSAMRVSFCGEIAKSKEDAEMLAYLSAIPTHNHPEGIKGAITTAVCIYMAKTKATKDEILEYAISQYPLLKYQNSPKKPLSEYDKYKFYISCQDAVPFAIRVFYEYDDFADMMHFINSHPVDSDTIGAIAGSIFHSFYGKCTDNDDEIIKDKLSNYRLLYSEYNHLFDKPIEYYDYACIDYLTSQKYHLVEEFYNNFDTLLKDNTQETEDIKVGWTCPPVEEKLTLTEKLKLKLSCFRLMHFPERYRSKQQ